jgi:DNA polymerase III delta prime subunit
MSNFSLNSLAHHAYCLVGDDAVRDELLLILENDHGILRTGNQDFYERKYETFTIDHARELKLAHEMRPVVNDGKKIFVIAVDGITVEAQNALLKLLEEPAEYAHFFLIVPAMHLLLPTVQSRLSFVDMNDVGVASNSEAKKFLSLDTAKKLEFVKKFVDDISKEKRTKRDAIDFLSAVQEQIRNEKGVKSGAGALEATELALKYINDRSPSLKMLLEYVALNV